MIPFLKTHFVELGNYPFFRNCYQQAFRKNAPIKILIVCYPHRISFSQVYPFLYYEKLLRKTYDADIRVVTLDSALKNDMNIPKGADHVMLQTWFNIEEDTLKNLVQFLINQNPDCRLHYLDSFAPTDLRLSKWLIDDIDLYIKKSLLKDREQYFRTMRGHTNLNEYYSKLAAIEEEPCDWETPRDIVNKLRLGPTFFTGHNIIEQFESPIQNSLNNRPVDIHARIATEGAPWYQFMRELSQQAVSSLSKLNIISGFGVTHKKFMQEMISSKLCFSPFGYGEICWRDIEAIQCGAVLIKPSMEHLDMEPNIHIPLETYVPVKWDFSDLKEKCEMLLDDETMRKTIAENAFSVIHEYVSNHKFLEQFSFLLKKVT